jgi:DNA segregation ATPase FtsK/SpoIIIE, S-DNA-T family
MQPAEARAGCGSTRLGLGRRDHQGQSAPRSGSRDRGLWVNTSEAPSLDTRLQPDAWAHALPRSPRGYLAAQGVRVAPVRRPVRLHEEAFGLVIGGLSLFILLSLLSWSHAAATWGGMAPTMNWGGPVGHRLASTLVHILGGGAFLVVGLLGYAAYLWCTPARRQQRLRLGLGGILLLPGSAALLHISLPSALAFMGDAGGVVGRCLGGLLLPYCNLGGTLLISAMVTALGGMMVVRPLGSPGRRHVRSPRRLGTAPLIELLARLGRRPASPRRRPRSASSASTAVVVAPTIRVAEDLAVADAAPSATLHAMPPLTPVRPGPGRRSTTEPPTATPYCTPPLSLFNLPTPGTSHGNGVDLAKQAAILAGKLHDFGVDGGVVQVLPGPVVTMYEFEPASGIKVSRIMNLADDLALGMKALSIRILAPVPGKSVVGIEVPNPHRQPVYLRQIVASPAFQGATSKLALALGKDILGTPTVTDLAQIPHLLIAGATGSGKSVGLNSMICSILLNATPEEVKFIMIDPKMLELSVYDGIPHLIAPVVTHPKKAAAALHWAVEEMERRYRLLAAHGVRGIEGYNRTHPDSRLPYLVVVIDELADLMLVARRDVEDALTRLAQMARAAGIHLLVATQRPSVDVLTGIIKANFPARLSFQVSSRTDSRTILDAIGAERLLGRGDMLFLPPGTSRLVRIHGAYVSEAEIKRVVDHLRTQQAPVYDESIVTSKADDKAEPEAFDEKYDAAVALAARLGQASASLMQRHLRIGYNRAARLIAVMEREGVVGPADGSRPRDVYVKDVPASALRA